MAGSKADQAGRRQLRDRTSDFALFFEQRVVVVPNSVGITANMLGRRYRDWCAENNKHPASEVLLFRALSARGITRTMHCGQTHYGIVLRRPLVPAPEVDSVP